MTAAAEWTTNDKLQHYRQILGLNDRDKNWSIILKQSKQISKLLFNDINEYRIIINENRRRKYLITLFQGHKDLLLLTLTDSSPAEILVHIFQDNCLKERQLNKLCYRKKLKMKKIFELKMAIAFNNKIINQEKKQVSAAEIILVRCQRSMARHNAAQSIRTTYESMLKILEKDAIYYDTISRTMLTNQKEQSKLILNTTLMGHIAAENLYNNRQKYNNTAKGILMNAIERERTLKIARVQVEFAQSLIQNNDTVEKLKESHTEGGLEKQIQILKQVFLQVKKSFHEQSIKLLLSRPKEQLAKNTNLLHHIQHIEEENDLLIKKEQHAQLILHAFQHTITSSVEQYKLRRLNMLGKIKMKKESQGNLKILRKVQEKLLLKVKGALQSIIDYIMDVKILKTNNEKEEEEEEEETADTNDVMMIDRVIQNATLMLSNIVNFDEEMDFFKKYKLKSIKDDESSTGDIFENDEYEIIDANVSTRKDIKKQSKQLVESRLII